MGGNVGVGDMSRGTTRIPVEQSAGVGPNCAVILVTF